MKKQGRWFFDPSDAHRRWYEWNINSKYADGQAVDKMATVEIGHAGGAMCRCPSGSKFFVGALVNPAVSKDEELHKEANYAQSCVNGVIQLNTVQQAADDETNLDVSTYGRRAVHCNVSGWPLDYTSVQQECDGVNVDNRDAC